MGALLFVLRFSRDPAIVRPSSTSHSKAANCLQGYVAPCGPRKRAPLK